MTARDELHLLSGAYALNSLDDSERAEFEGYLAESHEARTEVAELSDTAVLLGLSSRPVAPSPELKANLMALIAVTTQLGPEKLAAPAAAVSSPAAVPSLDEQRSIRHLASTGSEASGNEGQTFRMNRAEAKAQARWYRKPLNVLVAAAAAVALFAGGTFLGQGLGDANYELAQADSLAELSAAEDLQRSVSEVSGGGSATLVWSDALQRSAMLVDGLPQLDADKVYQLWYLDEAGATPAGTFVASDSGQSWRVLEGTRDDATAVGLTVEPEGGSSEPTTTPIVVIEEA